MSDHLSRVIVGNIVFHPEAIREFLKKSHYFMSYDWEKETLVLNANDGDGGRNLFEVRNVSYESARKLAEGPWFAFRLCSFNLLV